MSTSSDLKVVADILARLLTNLNDQGQYADDLADLQTIIDSVSIGGDDDYGAHIKNRNPDKFYFTSLNFVPMRQEQRPEVIRFVVTKGERVILNFQMDQSLTWILKENADGDLEAACKFSLGKHMDGARANLRKLAQAEIDKPGTFEEMVNPKPKILIKRAKPNAPTSQINYVPKPKPVEADPFDEPEVNDSEQPMPSMSFVQDVFGKEAV